MIPSERTAAVSQALEETFGTSTVENIQRITGGLSSDLIFRIVVKGSPYLLRIMTKIDERMDPHRIFACMNAASDAGITPQVRYANTAEGISITDFITAVPLPAKQALTELPRTLGKLHSLSLFPKTFNYVTSHNFFIWRFRDAGLLPQDEIEEVFTHYDQLCAVYPRLDADMVSCHSDLKPENILFDGNDVWLVDWQAAFVNDRYFDLSVAGNFLISGEGDECTYLGRYFGQFPNEYQCARFFLMRQAVHVFYATVFLLLGSGGKPISHRADLPAFHDLQRKIWEEGIDLADNEVKIVYGLVHWEQVRQNMRHNRFADSLRIVAEQNPPDVRLLLPLKK